MHGLQTWAIFYIKKFIFLYLTHIQTLVSNVAALKRSSATCIQDTGHVMSHPFRECVRSWANCCVCKLDHTMLRGKEKSVLPVIEKRKEMKLDE